MKQFKIIIFGLLFVLFGATLFWACSSEEEHTTDTKANFRTFNGQELADLQHLVNNFYEREVTLTIGVTATARGNDGFYDCTEIIIDSDTRARGYLVSKQATGEFLYFADVDRTNYILTGVDIRENQTMILNDINSEPIYLETNEFDFIEIIETPIYQTEGRFWGWSCGPKWYLPVNGSLQCFQNCHYYIVFMQASDIVIRPC